MKIQLEARFEASPGGNVFYPHFQNPVQKQIVAQSEEGQPMDPLGPQTTNVWRPCPKPLSKNFSEALPENLPEIFLNVS